MPHRRKQPQRSKHGLRERHNDLQQNPERSGPVQLGAFNQRFRYPLNKLLHNEHIPDGEQTGNDIDPEGIRQA
ncbi:hypothetical protein D3C73_1026170 [compost metagenome]